MSRPCAAQRIGARQHGKGIFLANAVEGRDGTKHGRFLQPASFSRNLRLRDRSASTTASAPEGAIAVARPGVPKRIMTVWLELAIVVGLTLLNGFFAMAELAIASSRRIRLQQMAEAGSRGAARALILAENPGRFLSAVQVGITLIGIMSGAYGGATLGARLGAVLNEYPIFAPRGDEIAFVIVVVAITALSVVVGELVPKRIALLQPEKIAAVVSGPVQILVLIARPLVWFLETSTGLLLKLLRIPEKRTDLVTEEEVKIAIAEGTEAGVIDEVEEEMIHGVLRLADFIGRFDHDFAARRLLDRSVGRQDRDRSRDCRLPLFAHRGRA